MHMCHTNTAMYFQKKKKFLRNKNLYTNWNAICLTTKPTFQRYTTNNNSLKFFEDFTPSFFLSCNILGRTAVCCLESWILSLYYHYLWFSFDVQVFDFRSPILCNFIHFKAYKHKNFLILRVTIAYGKKSFYIFWKLHCLNFCCLIA